jgi:isopenicillin-N epimerase
MCEEFDWVGTRDPTPYLTAPTALSWLRELGSANVARYNHELAWQAGQVLSASWGSACSVPESMVGTMICARLPEAAGASQEAADALRARLLFEHAIEVPLIAMSGAIWARVSAQIYNELADIERLAEAVRAHCRVCAFALDNSHGRTLCLGRVASSCKFVTA